MNNMQHQKIKFAPASRSKIFLKLACMGPSGSGKSMSSLLLAQGIASGSGKIAAIDTENGSLSLYSHVCPFDVITLDPPFAPEKYIEVIEAAVQAGYEVLIIDSFTHAWKFVLELKDQLDAKGGNRFANWKIPKERMDALKEKILQSPIHVICCMRAKTEYIQKEGSGTYQKAGMAAIAEPESEYEFTVVFDIGSDHKAVAGLDGRGKDRTDVFRDNIGFKITPKTGEQLMAWRNSGAELPAVSQPDESEARAAHASVRPTLSDEARAWLTGLNLSPACLAEMKWKTKEGGGSFVQVSELGFRLKLSQDDFAELVDIMANCWQETRDFVEYVDWSPEGWSKLMLDLYEAGVVIPDFLGAAAAQFIETEAGVLAFYDAKIDARLAEMASKKLAGKSASKAGA